VAVSVDYLVKELVTPFVELGWEDHMLKSMARESFCPFWSRGYIFKPAVETMTVKPVFSLLPNMRRAVFHGKNRFIYGCPEYYRIIRYGDTVLPAESTDFLFIQR
jgi:hypothetical protein